MARRSETTAQLDPASLTASIGSSGLAEFGGVVSEEFHRSLQGGRGAKVYREMADNDPVIGAVLYAMTSLLLRVSWRTEPADAQRPSAIEAAAFLDECIAQLEHPWSDVLDEALSMLESGWSYLETVYTRRPDGRLGWQGFYGRAQDTLDSWDFDGEGRALGWWQVAPPTYQRVYLPLAKGLHFRTRSRKNNPEGRSLLRNAYRPWFFKKRLEEMEGIGIEREMAGLPIAKVPVEIMSPSATAEQQAIRSAMESLVQSVRADRRAGLVFPTDKDRQGMPTGYEFGLVTSGGRRAIDPNTPIVRYEQRMAMSLLAQFLLMGMDKVGSFSLSSNMTDLFSVSLGALLDKVEETFHQHGTERLMRLNGIADVDIPRRVHGDIEKADIEALANAIQRLVGAGALTPDATLEAHLREEAELPQADPTTALGAGSDMVPARSAGDAVRAVE